MKPTLMVLAAGMGSRYGGLKQLDQVGPSGETIIDYSIYDAIRAGFGKIVFVIRRDIEQPFREAFIDRLGKHIEIDYVFQELDNLPAGYKVPEGRQKPWGTSHAILVTRDKIREPFGVINADDYYGVESFKILREFLVNDRDDSCYSIIGYPLGNTLSDHGHVNRGVCRVGKSGLLEGVVETRKISKTEKGIFAPGPDGKDLTFTGKEIVSMNLWGFKPTIYELLETEFTQFLRNRIDDPTAELDIPTSVDKYVKSGEITIKVLPTGGKWFGVTYREDKPFVVDSINRMVGAGIYPSKLF
ncbi:MAG: nucleotidyltransferase [Bacteroidales bacterium]|jgi:dTDP-glucose pyrophosphorylase|nr:nucleotidyltransferase [Bacteroidales bacterium]